MSVRLTVALALLSAAPGCGEAPVDGGGQRVTLLGDTSAEEKLRERRFEVRCNEKPGPVDLVLFCVPFRDGVTVAVIEGLAAGEGAAVDHAAVLVTGVPADAEAGAVELAAADMLAALVPVLGEGVPQRLPILRDDDPQLTTRVRQLRSMPALAVRLEVPDLPP
jgi:hypothetical protein